MILDKLSCYEEKNIEHLYKQVSEKDKDLQKILELYSYPPLWVRPNSFETLVLTILEQQVSLASAYAAYKKLKERIAITPTALMNLTDEELRSCYFSRQKIIYTRHLATAIINNSIRLSQLETETDENVRSQLRKIKGIGDWTVDIYLIHALKRTDVFPTGDLALVNSIKMVKNVNSITKDELLHMSDAWKPYRSLATMLFWHYYIMKKGIKITH